MDVNNTVIVDIQDWHRMCHRLKFGSDRTKQFGEYFNCKVKWKSRVDEWSLEDDSYRPRPVMILTFMNPKEASMFVLKWL